MAPKKCSVNGFSLYMSETKQQLAKQGIQMNMSEMPNYCKKGWEEMSTEKKESYRAEAKKRKRGGGCIEKYTSIGEKVKDVKRQSEESKSQSDAMYSYIEELVRMEPARQFLPKHKFILIHINSYTCESEGFYFPAEISMAEFSLKSGLIRHLHLLVGLDQNRANAPDACTADVNTHAINNHLIDAYSKMSTNYTAILLKIIGFIINKEVYEDVLSDPNLDMPPIYTAHSSTRKELMITTSSLFQLYQGAVKYADRTDFNRLLSVYHLDKLFMELKNISYDIKYPNSGDIALPSVAMATDNLTKDMINIMISIGCNFHEKLGYGHVCSNYYVCKWIYIISTHCCQYFDIKFVSGCHYDFNLSVMETPIEESVENLHVSKPDFFLNNYLEKKTQPIFADSFPALDGGSSAIVQQPIWNKPELKVNTNNKIASNKNDNFPPLGNSQNTISESPVIGMNSWCQNAGRGRSIMSKVQNNNMCQLNEKSKKCGGRGFNIGGNK